ncbi:hypothetical protein BDV96DRAFT_640607 [Lophiotrema nucula]|uniref:F-box domain-containing protein n=1 Tax=Lophiotrema nucula TaxID=690887 RepID=A0A6A5ZSI9_9PLEO|nr:hypothetical protein BDV96DRAFT_640607 [Lophiotrema nucula]
MPNLTDLPAELLLEVVQYIDSDPDNEQRLRTLNALCLISAELYETSIMALYRKPLLASHIRSLDLSVLCKGNTDYQPSPLVKQDEELFAATAKALRHDQKLGKDKGRRKNWISWLASWFIPASFDGRDYPWDLLLLSLVWNLTELNMIYWDKAQSIDDNWSTGIIQSLPYQLQTLTVRKSVVEPSQHDQFDLYLRALVGAKTDGRLPHLTRFILELYPWPRKYAYLDDVERVGIEVQVSVVTANYKYFEVVEEDESEDDYGSTGGGEFEEKEDDESEEVEEDGQV